MSKTGSATLVFGILGGTAAVAQSLPLGATLPPPPPVLAPSDAANPRGPNLVTGTPGARQTIVIPGSPVPGTLYDNGNGTTTVLVPGGASQVIPTPR